jgi:hypothetical protein
MSEQINMIMESVENTLVMTLNCPLCKEEIITNSPFSYNISVQPDGTKIFSVSTSKFIDHNC